MLPFKCAATCSTPSKSGGPINGKCFHFGSGTCSHADLEDIGLNKYSKTVTQPKVQGGSQVRCAPNLDESVKRLI